MIRTNRTTRLLNVDSHERAVMIGVTVAVLVLVIAGKASEWRPASTAAVPVPPIILMATSYPTPSLPTPQPTTAPVVAATPLVANLPQATAIPTAAPAIVEPTPLPPTAVPPTEAPAAAPVEQAPAQQWVAPDAPVANPSNLIDQTEKIQELPEAVPQEVAHPWAPDLPPPRSAGNGAQS